MTRPTPIDSYIKVCRDEYYTDVHHELVISDFVGNTTAFEFEDASEDIAALKSELAAAQEALEEREEAMHLRIRATYDKTVADAWKAELAKAQEARQAAEARAERYAKILDECVITLRHARGFIYTREKMHPDGQALYDELLAAIDAAIAEGKS